MGECTCLDGDLWACVGGTVYGPCSAENCSGVCTDDGACECEADTHKPGRHGAASRLL